MGCEENTVDNGMGTFKDPRDGQTYQTIRIGDQEWMAENLNFPIGNSWCYDNNAANCDVYGRLYDWNAAVIGCPTGWHLPTDAEWTELVNFLGGADVAGGKLKEAGMAHWLGPNTGATNESGFTGLPGGLRGTSGLFEGLSSYGYWWSATPSDADHAYYRVLDFFFPEVARAEYLKGFGYSVRCVRD